MNKFIEIVLLFFIYSFIGWLWETVYCSLKAKKFVYRGFLVGPYCPIYGFGILGVLYFLEPLKQNIVVLYLLSTILVTILEYITSYGLEKMFHASWWDYKDVPLNINGRVALPVSLFWGIGCVLIVRVIHPRVMLFEEFLSEKFGIVLPIILLLLIITDLIYTLANMQSFKKVTAQISTAVEERKQDLASAVTEKREELSANLSELKETVTEEMKERKQSKMADRNSWLEEFKESPAIKKLLTHMNYNQKRWIRNYPNLKLKNVKNPFEVQQIINKSKKKSK
ncbi:putative ABC transporter permease [Enterococcus sp. AZ126]|uniref:putative ABC transporter permease n=1 Tax=Enterococcus sp. AZ126 TaxID=2774635 RepID=UPI003F1F40AC